MEKTNNTTKQSNEEIKMRKYIVEAPEPKKGQKASSGGIRENGKLAAQFKNPVPYEEPALSPAVINQYTNGEFVCKEQERSRRTEVGMHILDIVWQEFGEPLLRSGIHKFAKKMINKIEIPSVPKTEQASYCVSQSIDVEEDKIETVYNEEKIIRFPNYSIKH